MEATLRGNDQQQSAAANAAAVMIDLPSNWLQSFTLAAAAAAAVRGAAQHWLCARTHSHCEEQKKISKVSSPSVRLRQPDDLTPEGVQRLLLILAITPPSLSKAMNSRGGGANLRIKLVASWPASQPIVGRLTRL